jgi:hypothetical protein
MPFTLAHPAAVYPIRRWRWLAVPPLIVGSLAPDVAANLPWTWLWMHRVRLPYSHTLLGTVCLDLPVGVILLLLLMWLRRPLTAPLWEPHRGFVRAGLEAFRARTDLWLTSLVSLMIGSVTHVVADSFTHHNDFMVRHLPILRHEMLVIGGHPLAVYHLLQYVLSAAGLLLMAHWYLGALRESGKSGTGRRWRKLLLAGMVGTSLAAGMTRLAVATVRIGSPLPPYQSIGTVLATAMLCFALLYAAVGLVISRRPAATRRALR